VRVFDVRVVTDTRVVQRDVRSILSDAKQPRQQRLDGIVIRIDDEIVELWCDNLGSSPTHRLATARPPIWRRGLSHQNLLL